MKNGIKKTALLVVSCASLLATVGYSSWIVESNKSYLINNKDTVSKPVAYIVGNEKIKYTTIERALDVAQSGDIVMLIPPTDSNYHSSNNKITPNKVSYKISRDCTIKEGVSLVIPTDAESASSIKDANSLNSFISSMSNDDRNRGGDYTQSAQSDSIHYLRVTMQLDDGVTLVNKGSLIVSGYLSGGLSNGGSIGRTSHSYSQISLGKNSRILQDTDSALIDCFGFIVEGSENNGSKIDIAKGKLYLPLVIYDYRGFTFSVSMTDGALSKQHCSPFNRFGLENVQTQMNVAYNASVIGISNLYVKYDTTVDNNFYNEVPFVGNESSAFIQLTDSTYSSYSSNYSKADNKAKVVLYGGAVLNNINLTLKATNSMSVSFSTVDSFLPVTNMFDVTFAKASGQVNRASFDLSKQRVKILPGSRVEIQSGCSITANDIIVYSAFYDGKLGNGPTAVNGYDSMKYPLLEAGKLIVENGALISTKAFGGTVYCDDSSLITSTATSVVSKEAWNLKSSGKLNPPWTTDDYLEIREEKTIVPMSYLNKVKISCGVNIFTENSSNIPSYDVVFDDGNSVSVKEFQKVIFLDERKTFSMSFKDNIYAAYDKSKFYPFEESLNDYSTDGNAIIGVVASGVKISSNNSGKNDFEVQSVTVNCATPLVDGEVPLYVDSAIQLRATVDDAEKAYDKTIVWKSSDETIASVDQTGKVTGKKLGDVVISATCGGVTGTFETKVIPSKETTPISSITITDSKKDTATMDVSKGASQSFDSFNSSNEYGNKQSIDFTLSLNNGAQWASIEWTLTASATGRQYLNDSANRVNTVMDTEKVTLHTVSGTGKDDDAFTLVAKVTELGSGKTYTMKLTLIHKADFCIVYDTLILMANGEKRPVQDLKPDDFVLAFDHERGVPVSAKLFFNYHQDEDNIVTAPILKLLFDNGESIGVHVDHGFFDCTRMRYVYINKGNFEKYLGDDFVFIDHDGKLGKTKLLSGDVKIKTVKVYSPVSERHLNIFANGLLSITGEIEGWFNYFDYDTGLKYDEDSMKRDVERYGLYEYDDFKEYIRKEIFDLLPIPYLKVSVGKGLTTKKKIIEVMKKYLSFM